MPTYRIDRMYFDDEVDNEVIETGLTLEQAQAHCHDPETSSSTAKSDTAVRRTTKYGAWFDGYEEER